MSSSVEASELMRRLAEPAPAGAHIETLIRDAGRRAGLTFSRAKSVWYREARAIRAEEMDALRRAARKQDEAESGLRQELRDLRSRLARLEARLGPEGAQHSGEASGERC